MQQHLQSFPVGLVSKFLTLYLIAYKKHVSVSPGKMSTTMHKFKLIKIKSRDIYIVLSNDLFFLVVLHVLCYCLLSVMNDDLVQVCSFCYFKFLLFPIYLYIYCGFGSFGGLYIHQDNMSVKCGHTNPHPHLYSKIGGLQGYT